MSNYPQELYPLAFSFDYFEMIEKEVFFLNLPSCSTSSWHFSVRD